MIHEHNHPPGGQCPACLETAQERIAQLEADLKMAAKTHHDAVAIANHNIARAEKAEAEAERLRNERRFLIEHARKHCGCEARGCSVALGFADADRRDVKIAIQGGGRESGGSIHTSSRSGGEDLAGTAAANPAAPWCLICMSWPHELDCPAARKERDG